MGRQKGHQSTVLDTHFDIDPAADPIPIHPDDIVRLARGEVAENVVILDEKWLEVEVAAAPDGIFGSAMLAATSHSSDWHFSVDRNGIPTRGDAWSNQRVAAQSPGSVRILVMELEDGGTMSKAQWFCIQALVTAINDALGLEEVSLPISLQQGLT